MPGNPISIPPIPSEIARKAKSVFGRNNFYILVGEHWASILEGVQLEDLPPTEMTSIAGGAILPMVTFFQFVESLTDIQATDAFRTRIDWKFALHLPVITAGFDQKSLCEFRRRVIFNSASQDEFQKLINRFVALYPPLKREFEQFEVLNMLAAICSLNRLNKAEEAMSQTIESLAGGFPEWLRQIALPHWYGRYRPRSAGLDSASPIHQRELSMTDISADVRHLLEEAGRSNSPEIEALPEIAALRRIWEQSFDLSMQGVGGEIMNGCIACIGQGTGNNPLMTNLDGNPSAKFEDREENYMINVKDYKQPINSKSC